MTPNVTQDSDVLMSWLLDEVTDSAFCKVAQQQV